MADDERSGVTRHDVLAHGAIAAGLVWATPVVRSVRSFGAAGTPEPPTSTTPTSVGRSNDHDVRRLQLPTGHLPCSSSSSLAALQMSSSAGRSLMTKPAVPGVFVVRRPRRVRPVAATQSRSSANSLRPPSMGRISVRPSTERRRSRAPREEMAAFPIHHACGQVVVTLVG